MHRLDLARCVGVSVRHLERLFADNHKTTLRRYDTKLRLERAQGLIRQTTLTILENAIASGFASSSHFSRAYRGRYGELPTLIRRRERTP